jgi:putative transposase
MIITYHYKLYGSQKNHHLDDSLRIACNIYNHCISLHKRYYKIFKKKISLYTLQKHITKLKSLKIYEYWNKINSQTIQDVTERIERSYQAFFKNTKKARPPKFKCFRKYKSITFKQTGFKLLDNNKIKIGGKTYRYFKSRSFEGKIKTMIVKRDNLGDYYIYFTIEQESNQETIKTGKIAGCDFGLKTFLTTNEEEKIESPEYFKINLNKIKTAHRNLSKKVKGSNNRYKAKQSLARLYRKVDNQRRDFQYKLANDLASRYDVLIFEDLNLEGMKRLWGRKISDLAFDKFLRILEWICKKKGKEVKYIDRWFPSSKACSECGIVNNELRLKDRSWTCACGAEHDRDVNAAKNILRVGTSTLSGDLSSGNRLAAVG